MEELGLAVRELEAEDGAMEDVEAHEDEWAERPGFHRLTIYQELRPQDHKSVLPGREEKEKGQFGSIRPQAQGALSGQA